MGVVQSEQPEADIVAGGYDDPRAVTGPDGEKAPPDAGSPIGVGAPEHRAGVGPVAGDGDPSVPDYAGGHLAQTTLRSLVRGLADEVRGAADHGGRPGRGDHEVHRLVVSTQHIAATVVPERLGAWTLRADRGRPEHTGCRRDRQDQEFTSSGHHPVPPLSHVGGQLVVRRYERYAVLGKTDPAGAAGGVGGAAHPGGGPADAEFRLPQDDTLAEDQIDSGGVNTGAR